MEEKLTTRFEQVRKAKPGNFRSYLRNMALNGLSLKAMLPNAKKYFKKPRVQFLYIHHVFDDEIEKFDKLLSELSRFHNFIGYSEAVERILSNRIDKPYITISSDDGFRNNLEVAKVLEKYNAKACFFINPDMIGVEDYHLIKQFCKEKLNFPPTAFLNWSDIERLQKSGHEIGSHTMGHINIAKTGKEEVRENLNRSFEMIKKNCGEISHFAYPYGRFFHFNQIALEQVFEVGYTSCASAERGCHISPQEKLLAQDLFIRRDHIICDWSLNHIQYFLLNNSQNSTIHNNFNPYK